MRSHKKQRTRSNETKVNVEAIWLDCPELVKALVYLVLLLLTIACDSYVIHYI